MPVIYCPTRCEYNLGGVCKKESIELNIIEYCYVEYPYCMDYKEVK